jgi:hypothetical protein
LLTHQFVPESNPSKRISTYYQRHFSSDKKSQVEELIDRRIRNSCPEILCKYEEINKMVSLASAFPILLGKREQWKHFSQEMAGPRHSEYTASRNRLGITREVAYWQQAPQGDLAIVYFEAQNIARVFEGFSSSQEPFDVWFREQVKQIHGIDFSQPLPGPLPEAIVDWRAN